LHPRGGRRDRAPASGNPERPVRAGPSDPTAARGRDHRRAPGARPHAPRGAGHAWAGGGEGGGHGVGATPGRTAPPLIVRFGTPAPAARRTSPPIAPDRRTGSPPPRRLRS